MKIGDGGADSEGPGLLISEMRLLTSWSVAGSDNHLTNNWSIVPFAIWKRVFCAN